MPQQVLRGKKKLSVYSGYGLKFMIS